MIDLLSILVCPATGQGLLRASPALVDLLNKCIEKKLVRSTSGQAISKPVSGLLLRRDLKVAYVERDDLPIMIAEQAVEIQYVSDRRWIAALKDLRTEMGQ